MIAFSHSSPADADRHPRTAGGVFARGEASAAQAPGRNRLLRALPPDVRALVQPHLTPVRLTAQEVLFAASVPTAHVYFPETAVASLRSDHASEVATIGYEGMTGLELLLNGPARDVPPPLHIITEISGSAQRMPAAVFSELAETPGPFHGVLLRYTETFVHQLLRAAGCNGRHRLAPRCASWLLATHDRVAADTFPAPLAFAAVTLGVRPGGVAVVMHAFEDAGLIDVRGATVRILDAPRLEAAACGCHRALRARYGCLLPPVV